MPDSPLWLSRKGVWGKPLFGVEALGKPALGPVFSEGRAGRPRIAKSGFPHNFIHEGRFTMLHVVLYAPEIPQNTGNIARTCAATRTELILIEPLGFQLEDKYMKRAGLDYFSMVDIQVLPDFEALMKQYPGANYHFASTKAPRAYTEAVYGPDDFLVFGCETKGLPESLLQRVYDRCARIPMREDARSLNLANSVAIVVYEALRQQGFPGLSAQGSLTGRQDEAKAWMDYV